MPEEPLSEPLALPPASEDQLPVEFDPQELLPAADLSNVTDEVLERTNRQTQALLVLGPAGGAVTECPGNQLHTPDIERCPFFGKCDLRKAGVAPTGQPCPIERSLVVMKFSAWTQHLERSPLTLREDERALVSQLTWIDLQESRCLAILSQAQNSRLTHKNIKEVHPSTGEPLSWEWVIHVNEEVLDRLVTQRRMLFRDWEMTPEMKTKKSRLEGKNRGTDLGSRLSATADKLRRLGVGTTPPEPNP